MTIPHNKILPVFTSRAPLARGICLQSAEHLGRLHCRRRWNHEIAAQSRIVEPFRKHLKDEAKARRANAHYHNQNWKDVDARLRKWELTVGLEIHAELNTARKLFSTAATSTFDAPNTHVALFDAAFPGAQPRFQKETLIPALRAAIALNCEVQRRSGFDRKHYFYQDQPAGYQITQYYKPFARNGRITLYDYDGIAPEDGTSTTIDIKQIQMEQDTAKTLQQSPSQHLLDFNRVSHPLIEIITLPQIHQPSTAAACVKKIQAILRSVDAVTAGMEVGGLRVDVNVSVRQRHASQESGNHSYHGIIGLGQRTEIKNLSSIKAVEDAIIAERDRQIDVLEAGGVIEGETRGWSLGDTATRKLRGKEGEIDYRYMPDPDIEEVVIAEDLIKHLTESLPMLPDAAIRMLNTSHKYGLTTRDAIRLLGQDDGSRLDYYMDVVERLHQMFSVDELSQLNVGKDAGNWTWQQPNRINALTEHRIIHELEGLFTISGKPWSSEMVTSDHLASILQLLFRKQITRQTAKQLLAKCFSGEISHTDAITIDDDLLLQPMSNDEYMALGRAILDANPREVSAITEKGQKGKVMFLVGKAMRMGQEGRVEAQKAKAALEKLLGIL